MLQRIVETIHEKNPEMRERTRTTMKPPMLMRIGTKKTLWANFPDICKSMKRNPEHVFQVPMTVTEPLPRVATTTRALAPLPPLRGALSSLLAT